MANVLDLTGDFHPTKAEKALAITKEEHDQMFNIKSVVPMPILIHTLNSRQLAYLKKYISMLERQRSFECNSEGRIYFRPDQEFEESSHQDEAHYIGSPNIQSKRRDLQGRKDYLTAKDCTDDLVYIPDSQRK